MATGACMNSSYRRWRSRSAFCRASCSRASSSARSSSACLRSLMSRRCRRGAPPSRPSKSARPRDESQRAGPSSLPPTRNSQRKSPRPLGRSALLDLVVDARAIVGVQRVEEDFVGGRDPSATPSSSRQRSSHTTTSVSGSKSQVPTAAVSAASRERSRWVTSRRIARWRPGCTRARAWSWTRRRVPSVRRSARVARSSPEPRKRSQAASTSPGLVMNSTKERPRSSVRGHAQERARGRVAIDDPTLVIDDEDGVVRDLRYGTRAVCSRP